MAYTLIFALAIGCFEIATRFWVELHWRRWAVYSCVTGVLMLVFWGMFIQGANGNIAGLTPIAGLMSACQLGVTPLAVCPHGDGPGATKETEQLVCMIQATRRMRPHLRS